MRTNFWKVWGMPLLLAALTLFGLLSALLGSGIWNWLSWIALATPVYIGMKHLMVAGKKVKQAQR